MLAFNISIKSIAIASFAISILLPLTAPAQQPPSPSPDPAAIPPVLDPAYRHHKYQWTGVDRLHASSPELTNRHTHFVNGEVGISTMWPCAWAACSLSWTCT